MRPLRPWWSGFRVEAGHDLLVAPGVRLLEGHVEHPVLDVDVADVLQPSGTNSSGTAVLSAIDCSRSASTRASTVVPEKIQPPSSQAGHALAVAGFTTRRPCWWR